MDYCIVGVLVLICSQLTVVQSFSTGAPISTCLTMFPKHKGTEKMVSPSPFAIRLSSQTYRPSQEITVFIEGSGEKIFRGLQIRAHRVKGDTEIIMGTFTNFPDKFLQPLSCFGGLNNMLTHKNNAMKRNVTLTWKAPDVPVGDLVFTTTIVASFNEFWGDQKSVIMKDPSGTVDLGNLEQIHNVNPEIDFDGTCGQTRGCFLFPRHCMGDDCLAAVSFHTQDGHVHFEMMGKAEGWVSLGFSHDKLMGDDETLSCTAQDSRVTVQRGYNPALHNDRQYTAGIVNMTTVQKDGYIYCRFSRPIVMSDLVSVNYTSDPPTPINHSFDFSEDWYLFLGWGYTYVDTDVMGKHTELPVVTENKVSLSSTVVYRGSVMSTWLQAHGCLAVIAWMLLVGMGTVVARHYRQGIGAKMACGQKRWFQFHRLLVGLAAACTAASFILIFVKIGGWSKHVTVHAYLGIAIMAATVLQVSGGLIRPSPASKIRPVFNYFHRILGKLTHAAAAVEIYFAFDVPLFPHTMRKFGFILVLVWVITQVFWEIVMEIMSCCKSRSSSKSDYDVSNNFKIEEKYPEETNRVANVILALYMLNVTIITLAALCAVLLF
ncbi:ferric-chelate reductase 1-like [Liolophura sinensis]|uniref:ferric-chelate reductase 1-like n=1 Tax=Liolophura sinensis TaxID=3198878 RepID=UPI003158E4DF